MSMLPSTEHAPRDPWLWWSLGIGVLAMIGAIAGTLADPAPFFRAYLAAYMFYLALGLGGMAILMLYHLTGGAWGYLIRRLLEAQMRTLPLLAVAFIPIPFGARYLYLWAQADVVAAVPKLQMQQAYLNVPMFAVRAAVYFTVWLVLAYFLSRWSWEEDHTGDSRYPWRNEQLSGPGLVLYGITLHFAVIDWVLSLQPIFPSTIIGPLVAAGQFLSALAFALIVLGWLAPRPHVANVVSPKALNDLGNLLLTFLVVWSYMVWFQFMIVWIANLPEEVVWYLPRGRGGWLWVGWALLVLQFVLPFVLLLFRAVKQSAQRLARVAGLVLLMQLVYWCFEVLPLFPPGPLISHWIDLVLAIGMGGIWLAAFLFTWQRWPVLPLHDVNQRPAIHLRQEDEEEAARKEALLHG